MNMSADEKKIKIENFKLIIENNDEATAINYLTMGNWDENVIFLFN
jgi:hypothetical protein